MKIEAMLKMLDAATETAGPETVPSDTLPGASQQLCKRRIRAYVGRQPPEVKVELGRRTNWCWGALSKGDDLCLIAHVADIRSRLGLPLETRPTVYREFDRMAGAIGLPATVALVRDACGALK